MTVAAKKKPTHARRPGVLPTAGLIVERDAEFKALPLLCNRSLLANCPPLRAINLQGVGTDRAPIGIAKMVKPKVIQHQVAKRYPIVICIDREQRAMTAAALATSVMTELRTLLQAEGRSIAGVHIAIADRTFEAWILADARGLHEKKLFVRAPKFHSFEGEMGRENKKGVAGRCRDRRASGSVIRQDR